MPVTVPSIGLPAPFSAFSQRVALLAMASCGPATLSARRLPSMTRASFRTALCTGSTCRSTGRSVGPAAECLRHRCAHTAAPGRDQFRLQPEPARIRPERPAPTAGRRRGAEHAAFRDQLDHRHRRPSRSGHGDRPARRRDRFSARRCMSTGWAKAITMSLPVFGPSTTRDFRRPRRGFRAQSAAPRGGASGNRVSGGDARASPASATGTNFAGSIEDVLYRSEDSYTALAFPLPAEPPFRAARRRCGLFRPVFGRSGGLRPHGRGTLRFRIRTPISTPTASDPDAGWPGGSDDRTGQT